MNETFRKTASAMSQPVFWLAIGLLFFNDHFLRVYQPSWLSGILGDFAWLLIAPLVLLLVLSLGWQRAPRWLALVAFGLIGVVYTLGNVWPAFLAWLSGLAERVLGMPVNMVSDVGDLLALPALLASYLLWQRANIPPGFSNPRKIFVVLGALLTAGLTVANMPVMKVGIHKLRTTAQGTIFACSLEKTFTSQDGGFTWESERYEGGLWCAGDWKGTLSVVENGSEVQYRFNEDNYAIEHSPDGETWKLDYQLKGGSQADHVLYERAFPDYGPYRPWVMDMDFDPVSGNIITALDTEGVLVRTPDGVWHQVGVGEYTPRKVDTLQEVISILTGELVLAFLLGCLLVSIFAIKIKRKAAHIILLTASIILWILACLEIPAVFDWNNYPRLLMIGCGIILLPAFILSIKWLLRQMDRTLIMVFSIAFGTALGFFTPFILWAIDVIQEYNLALMIGLLIACAGSIWLMILFRPLSEPYGVTEGN